MKLIAHSLNVFFAVYLCLHSINRCPIERHSESVLHITVLTTIPALLLTTLSLVPDTPSQLNLRQVSSIGDNLWYIVFYLSACILAFTAPQGPPLHYPPSAVYQPKVVESITNKDEENVTGLAACSPWGYLMFPCATKVVMLGNIAESREIGDLPILPNLVGIFGRTGSGKSTLALSFFRFVEATEGRILVDDIDIADVGLTDLRSGLAMIPQDPTILSGTLKSTLDVFSEYDNAEIFEGLRRVHPIPSSREEEDQEVNAKISRDLDASVGGDNFSTGYSTFRWNKLDSRKQLLCMARAILKRSKVLVMDEASSFTLPLDVEELIARLSVGYSMDELISQTIRHTILTIAHRLRTIIDYDRIMLLDQGRIVEFDRPQKLLAQPSSRFYALCKPLRRTSLPRSNS
ncbi:hypothetical protein E1B28_000184 [Marasmius oreades]|uniref:ABC transporter domain-containing protein n=1 Tax=Marasmius oreades TaxID=181124 RepID=A0A9P8AE33_9AGAR|nr:uncharacterized protein E1B28_000184 [Marasmius oreades]KAG7098217.1 hypothetical protein E1B28_000184 [Marasmius oreades]